MSNNASSIEVLLENVQDYVKTTLKLTKLNAIAQSSDVISSVISKIVISIAAAMFILLLSFGLAFLIGDLMGNVYWGFFIVAAFYLLLAVLIYSFKDQWIKVPVSNKIITKLLKNME